MRSRFGRAVLWLVRLGFFLGVVVAASLLDMAPAWTVEWLLPVALYVLGHVFRMLRLMVLAEREARSLGDLLYAHCVSAPVSALLPLKLGEVYRIAEIGNALGGVGAGIRTVWVERALDGAVLAGLGAAVSLAFGAAELPALTLAIAGGGFIAASLVVATLAVPGLSAAKMAVLRRYEGEGSVRVLAVLERVRAFFGAARGMVAGRGALLISLTLLAWVAEVLALVAAPLPLLAMVGQGERFLVDVFGVLGGIGQWPGYETLVTTGVVVVVLVAVVLPIVTGIASLARRSRRART